MLACVDYFFLFFYYCLADSHTCTRTRSNLQCAHSLRMTTKIIIKKKKKTRKSTSELYFTFFFFLNGRCSSVSFFFFFDWMVLLCSGKVRDARGAVSAFSFFFLFLFYAGIAFLNGHRFPPLFFFFKPRQAYFVADLFLFLFIPVSTKPRVVLHHMLRK